MSNSMEEIKIKIGEVYALLDELVGNKKTEGSFEGLLNMEGIDFITRYHLTTDVDTLLVEKTRVEKLKEELIKKYGTVNEDGTISIKTVSDEDSTKYTNEYVSFVNEFNTLLLEEISLKLFKVDIIKFVDVDVKNDKYSWIYKFLIK